MAWRGDSWGLGVERAGDELGRPISCWFLPFYDSGGWRLIMIMHIIINICISILVDIITLI